MLRHRSAATALATVPALFFLAVTQPFLLTQCAAQATSGAKIRQSSEAEATAASLGISVGALVAVVVGGLILSALALWCARF